MNDEEKIFNSFIDDLAEGKRFKAIGVSIYFSKDGIQCGLDIEGKGMVVAETIYNLKRDEIIEAMELLKREISRVTYELSDLILERNPDTTLEEIQEEN